MIDHPVIYSGFDTLELSYRVAPPRSFLERLGDAQTLAKADNRAVPVNFCGSELFVEPSGGQGGYAYRAHTGPLGLIWKFREATATSPWSVHVKFRAHGLAIKGPLKMKSEADAFLRVLGCRFDVSDVRVARADFAVDILLDNYRLNTDYIVFHARANVSEHIERTRTGEFFNYVRIGRMPGKQLCIYNKSEAILQSRDSLWRDIFEQSALSRLGLIIDDFRTLEIWRFELRAGKKFLDTKIRPRTWESFLTEARSCFLILSRSFKLKTPTCDLNRTRWPLDPIWRSVIAEIECLKLDHQPARVSDEIWEKLRQEYQDGLDKQLVGLLLSSAACEGVTTETFSSFVSAKVKSLTEDYCKSNAFAERFIKRRAEYVAQFKA
ncbi:MAG: hypothetical protein AAFX54_11385 [Pseudomonadota bacterium]